MAKTYLEIVKYLVEAKFTIDGVVDKPDIIGAVFGQTEGLLGSELDLRELQKNGKIGRIEIEVNQSSNKTYGKLFLPASLDRIETCILAAAIESVDRVGPYEANFGVDKVEDTRSEKRRKILNRAKELLRLLLNTELPDSKEIAELVQSDVRAAEVTTYGPEQLPAGPDVGKSDEIIIVEGRADVLNLLRNDITNAIAIGGAITNVPKSIATLANEKESTVFLDGDRGGDLILRSLMNVAEIDFVARAPEGKEVEELTRKEIIKSMRTRVPTDQYQGAKNRRYNAPQPPGSQQQPQQGNYRPTPPRPQPQPEPQRREQTASVSQPDDARDVSSILSENPNAVQQIEAQSFISAKELTKVDTSGPKPALQSIILTTLAGALDELSGTLRSRLYDSAGNVVKEIPIRELLAGIEYTNGVYAIVLDGVITQRLVELSLQKGVKAVYGVKANPLTRKYHDIILYTKEQGTLR